MMVHHICALLCVSVQESAVSPNFSPHHTSYTKRSWLRKVDIPWIVKPWTSNPWMSMSSALTIQGLPEGTKSQFEALLQWLPNSRLVIVSSVAGCDKAHCWTGGNRQLDLYVYPGSKCLWKQWNLLPTKQTNIPLSVSQASLVTQHTYCKV